MCKWKCDCCGLCCKHVDRVPSLRGLADETGRCKYLDEHNLCSIYENRPEVCNVAWIYEHYFKEHISEDDFYEITEKSCQALKNEIVSTETYKLANNKLQEDTNVLE